MLCAGFLSAHPLAYAKGIIRTVEGTVVKVSDGDTIGVEEAKGTKLKIRLYGIDAPETEKKSKKTGHISKLGQPYGEEAFRTLEKLIHRRRVKVDIIDRDRYHRFVGIIWLGDNNINREMVAEGYAWAYRRYLDAPYASEFIELEAQARKRRLGLWHQDHPQPPWEFRQFQVKNKQGKQSERGRRLHG